MKRFWVFVTIASLTLLNPLFAQTGKAGAGDTTKKEAPAGEPSKTDSKMDPADGKKETKGEGAGALWEDKNGTRYVNSRVKFTLASTDTLSDVDYVEYRIDDGKYVKYSGEFTLQEEGAHSIIYRATDKAGNKEVDRVFTVVVDNNAPEVRVLPSKPFFIKDGRNYTSPGNFFTIRATDQYSGVKIVEYSVNSNELKKYEGDTIKLESPGTQFVRFRAEDNLGNKTVDSNMVIEVDSEKPAVDIVTTSALYKVGEVHYARRNTGFVVKGTDAGSGVARIMVRIDGSTEWQTYSDALYFDTEKEHTIEAKVIDAVGNESETKTIKFTVDDNPPVTKIESVVK